MSNQSRRKTTLNKKSGIGVSSSWIVALPITCKKQKNRGDRVKTSDIASTKRYNLISELTQTGYYNLTNCCSLGILEFCAGGDLQNDSSTNFEKISSEESAVVIVCIDSLPWGNISEYIGSFSISNYINLKILSLQLKLVQMTKILYITIHLIIVSSDIT